MLEHYKFWPYTTGDSIKGELFFNDVLKNSFTDRLYGFGSDSNNFNY